MSSLVFFSACGFLLVGLKNNNNNFWVKLEKAALFRRLSVLIQLFNAVLLHDCFVDEVAGHSS